MAADTVVYVPTLPVQRNRLTVFFRGILWLPHYMTLAIYSIGAVVAVLLAWFAIVFTARYPPAVMTIIIWFVAVIVGRTSDDLHSALNLGVSYTARASAYFWLLTQDWPQITQETSAVAAGGFASETFRAPTDPGRWLHGAPASSSGGWSIHQGPRRCAATEPVRRVSGGPVPW